MKKIVVFMLFLAGLSSTVMMSAKDNPYFVPPTGNYTLDVEFKDIPDSIIFTLRSADDPVNYRQKVFTKDNKLHFCFDVMEDYPVYMYLTGTSKDKKERFIKWFYIAKNVNQKLISAEEGFNDDSVVITGSPWEEVSNDSKRLFNEYMKKISDIDAELKSLLTFDREGKAGEIYILGDDNKQRYYELQALKDKINKAYNDSIHNWILTHPDNPYALSQAFSRRKRLGNEAIAQLVGKVSDNMRLSPECVKLCEYLKTNVIQVGSRLADFDLAGENHEGQQIKLSQIAAPFILVDFTSLGCGPCRMAAKHEIPELLKKYGDSLAVVSYICDKERERMLKVHELDKPTWAEIWNGSGPNGDDCVKYGATGYPTFFLFGPDRTLLMTWSGWGPGSIDMRIREFLEGYGKTNE